MLAVRLGAELSLLHVVAPTESQRMLDEDIERARRELQCRATPPVWDRGPSPRVDVRSGNAARVLIETARELDAALVVVGTHRRRPMRDALAGTLAERLLRQLECPVLIVHRMPWYAYCNVLLALDCSKASAVAVRAAEELVLSAGTRACVVHACQPAAVQNASSRLHPDLLVVGTRGRGRWRRAVLGSVANRLLSGAKSDVLVLPPRDFRANWRKARADRLALDVVSGA
jgi:nucleotide-binding universal stress UspA family protein